MNEKMDKKIYFRTLGLVCVFVFFMCQAASAAIIMQDDFEGSWEDDWHAEPSTWEAGVPTSGPLSAYGGTQVAATVLTGNYPDTNIQTRFIRHISFLVPSASVTCPI